MMQICNNSRQKLIFIVFIALLAVLSAWVSHLTPLCFDDLWYKRPLGSEGCSIDTFLATFAESLQHWGYDTGRAANLVAPLFLGLFPRVIYSIVYAIMTFAMLFYAAKAANVRTSSLVAWLLVAALMLVYPWYEYMYNVIYGLNYLASSALTVMFMYFAVRIIGYGAQPNRWSLVGICAVGLACGWFHEGFSVPLACGFLAYIAVIRCKLTGRVAAPAICFGVGVLLIIISPALWNRAAQTMPILERLTGLHRFAYVAVFNCMAFVYAVMALVMVCIRRFRSVLSRRDVAFMAMIFVSCAVAVCISYAYYLGPRTGTFSQLVGAVGCAYLANLFPWRAGRRFSVACRAVIFLALIINLIAACNMQSKLLREYDEIKTLYIKSDHGTIYYDNMHPVPDLSLFKTSIRQFNERFPTINFSDFYGGGKGMLCILPTSMRGYRDSVAECAPSQANAKIYHGNIVIDDARMAEAPVITVTYDDGSRCESRFYSNEFVDADGETHILIKPHSSLFTTSKVVDVNF